MPLQSASKKTKRQLADAANQLLPTFFGFKFTNVNTGDSFVDATWAVHRLLAATSFRSRIFGTT